MKFGRNKQQTRTPVQASAPAYARPAAPARSPMPCPTAPTRSVPFMYDPENRPAAASKISLLKKEPGHINLVKSAEAATAALAGVNLGGLQAEVIVLLDSSYSMHALYERGLVQELLVRTLGWALNVDADGSIPVIAYGHHVAEPVTITTENYQQAPDLLPFQKGSTPMAEALEAALAMAQSNDKLTIIFNLTDGDPDDREAMNRAVISSSTQPVFLKNLALKQVLYLTELDDMPSLWEIRMDDDDKPVLNADESLIIDKNTHPVGDSKAPRRFIDNVDSKAPRRFIDNVDSQSVDPYGDSPEVFAAKMTEELGTLLEVHGRAGILTGLLGVTRDIF